MRQHPLFFPYLALASVCFFWGTTYLGIRIALEGFPPLLLVGTRFLIAGVIMLAIDSPPRQSSRKAANCG